MTTNVDRRANAVAIVSADPLIAALLGAAVELTGFRAAFPRAGESTADSLRRIRPVISLLDAGHPAARDEAVLGRALMSDVRVLVFGRLSEVTALRSTADRYGIGFVVMPDDIARLEQILATNHPLARSIDRTTR